MGSRWLTQNEMNTAFTVFGHTIPYQKIYVTSALGIGNRPYTLPDATKWGYYAINIGSKVTWNTLIHELTHVWQGYNTPFAWDYVLNSVFSQALSSDAYAYKLGADWGDYNVEQQASIVEDWYKRGRSSKDKAFPYIRDYVWKGISKIGYQSNSDYDGILK